MPLPTVILPGYLAGAIEYSPLEQALRSLGYPAITVPIQKRDWFPTLGGRSMSPILQQLDRTVQQALQTHNASQINLIGHSAGGWISRIYLGEKPYWVHAKDIGQDRLWQAHAHVHTLITLGTPHTSLERWTRLNLDFVNNTYPGAFYPKVRYVCVAGKAIYGERRLKNWLAYSSYQITCGTGNCWGDGITPIAAAHLEGATNLTLEGVQHAPRARGIWYGSPEPLQTWAQYLA